MLLRTPTIVLALLFAVLIECGNSSCLTANNEYGPPDYRSMASNLKSTIFPLQHQAIIPSYKFNCCGAITEWTISIAVRNNDSMDTLSLQVWRPSPTVDETGCYTLVGNNNFTSTSLESQLTVVTPLPNERIQFQPGDVLGFYVENAHVGFSDGLADEGVMMLSDLNERGDRGYETEEVWYATNLVFSNANCLAAVGPGRLLDSSTNVAPIISVSYTMSDYCTNSLTSSTWTATRTHSTPSGTPVPTQPPTQSVVSDPLQPPPLIGRGATTLIIGISVAVLVIMSITLVAVVAICVKAKRRQAEKEKLAMVGSGAYSMPLLDSPTTHPTEDGT